MVGRARALESNCTATGSTKTTEILRKLAEMSKNPTIDADLSQVLDDFLQKLNETDTYLENGIFNMNFAEAALLLQSSADLYSKKVDLLWDIIFDYQQRIILSDEKNGDKTLEFEKLEERKRKYKRKRKTNSDVAKTKTLINNFSFGSTDNFDYVNQNYECHNLLKEWRKVGVEKQMNCDNQGQLCPSKSSLFLPNCSIHNEHRDYIGRYDQFHSASVIEEVFHLEANNLLPDEDGCVTKMRIDCYVTHDFLAGKSIPSNKPLEFYIKELKEYLTVYIESRKDNMKANFYSSTPSIQQLTIKQSIVNLERLPFNLVRDKMRRYSLADSLFDDNGDNFSYVSDNCDQGDELECSSEIALTSSNLTENSPGDLEIAALLNELVSKVSQIDTCDVDDEDNENISLTQLTRSVSCSKDSAFYELDDDMEESWNRSRSVVNTPVAPIEKTPVVNEAPTIFQSLCGGYSIIIPKTVKMKIPLENKLEEKIKRPLPPKRRRLTEKMAIKLITGVTANGRQFERFFRSNYKPSENEGSVSAELSSDSESDTSDEEDVPPDLPDIEESPQSEDELTEDFEETTGEDPLPIPNPHSPPCDTPSNSKQTCSYDNSQLFDSGFPSQHSELFEGPSEPDFEQEENFRRNVQEWRNFITPKLRNMENKSDFDIHEYGAKIIEPREVGDKVMFSDIVSGKRSAEVARFFIATLQLANANNVEISGAVPGEIANRAFGLTVKDKTRHHELLEEYQAPSEETFKERLERAKAMNPRVILHSTPLTEPTPKKIKLGKASRKKLSEGF